VRITTLLTQTTRAQALAMAIDARRVGRGDAAARIAGICLEMSRR
jgi:UDP-N-acetylglucosamine:LPS N-acetylglucosamine transferase